jgi:uncharacterized phiE125 gp8 family phage protein
VLRLPLSPLIAVERIGERDAVGQESDLAPALFQAEANADPPLIRIVAIAPDPGIASGGIAIELSAGFGAAVPAPLRQAIRMLVARWFGNRGDIAGFQTLPTDVQALVAPYQRARL